MREKEPVRETVPPEVPQDRWRAGFPARDSYSGYKPEQLQGAAEPALRKDGTGQGPFGVDRTQGGGR